MIHSANQPNEHKLQPGLWREEKFKVAPWKLLVFACPKCGMRSPVKVESKEPWEYTCLDRKCGFRDYVVLDGYEPEAGLEKPGEAEKLGA